MFQPQAASLQPVQAAVQQVTSQQTQVTNAQATAAQMAAAQVTSATTTVSPSNISVAALQTAGLSINPAIVRMLLQELYQFIVSVLFISPVVFTHVLDSCADQCCFTGRSASVSQFPHLHSHHHQCNVQHGWYHQPNHHKCPGTGESNKLRRL